MTIRNLEVPKREFQPGTTLEGYLVSSSVNRMPSDQEPGKFNERPQLILRDKATNEVFKCFLGSTAMDVLGLLVVGQFTSITKSKTKSNGAKGYYSYAVTQDDEDLDGAA